MVFRIDRPYLVISWWLQVGCYGQVSSNHGLSAWGKRVWSVFYCTLVLSASWCSLSANTSLSHTSRNSLFCQPSFWPLHTFLALSKALWLVSIRCLVAFCWADKVNFQLFLIMLFVWPLCFLQFWLRLLAKSSCNSQHAQESLVARQLSWRTWARPASSFSPRDFRVRKVLWILNLQASTLASLFLPLLRIVRSAVGTAAAALLVAFLFYHTHLIFSSLYFIYL